MKIHNSDRKTLLLVIHALNIGGGERVVTELVKKIEKEKYSVEVLIIGKRIENALTEIVEKSVPVRYLDISGKVTPRKIVYVMKSIESIAPDIVHSHLGGNIYCLLWALLKSKKLVITAHTIPQKAFHGYTEKLVRIALKLNRLVLVAVSEENYIKMKDYFNIDDRKCKCVNNGIDEDDFKREGHDGFVFINVARQDLNKNQALILRCFAKVYALCPNVKLLLLGDGPTHGDLLQQKQELHLGDEVQILGNVNDPSKYYAISDCYVQASHREALPMSVIEAMAAGLPVISTNVGGLKDVVKSNGYLVEDGAEEDYFRVMLRLLELPKDEYNILSKESKKIVHGVYSSKVMAENYENIYSSLT